MSVAEFPAECFVFSVMAVFCFGFAIATYIMQKKFLDNNKDWHRTTAIIQKIYSQMFEYDDGMFLIIKFFADSEEVTQKTEYLEKCTKVFYPGDVIDIEWRRTAKGKIINRIVDENIETLHQYSARKHWGRKVCLLGMVCIILAIVAFL